MNMSTMETALEVELSSDSGMLKKPAVRVTADWKKEVKNSFGRE